MEVTTCPRAEGLPLGLCSGQGQGCKAGRASPFNGAKRTKAAGHRPAKQGKLWSLQSFEKWHAGPPSSGVGRGPLKRTNK